MTVYKSSLLGDESYDDRQAGFQSVLDLMVDAAVNMCAGVSEARSVQKPKWDKDVFMLNCLSHLIVSERYLGEPVHTDSRPAQNVMQPFDFANYKVKALKEDIDTRAATLVADHVCGYQL